MAEHNILGQRGELLAAEFLSKDNYVILETNWRFGHKEIDIIALKNNKLIVVEVKTRRNDVFGKPYEAVGFRKQKFMIEAADAYINEKNIDTDVQFDIISIILKDEDYYIEHIKDAFTPHF